MFSNSTLSSSATHSNTEHIADILRMIDSYTMPERRSMEQTATSIGITYTATDYTFREMMASKTILFTSINRDEYFAITKMKSR